MRHSASQPQVDVSRNVPTNFNQSEQHSESGKYTPSPRLRKLKYRNTLLRFSFWKKSDPKWTSPKRFSTV